MERHRFQALFVLFGFLVLLSWTVSIGCAGKIGLPTGSLQDGGTVDAGPGTDDKVVQPGPDALVGDVPVKPPVEPPVGHVDGGGSTDRPIDPDTGCPPINYAPVPSKVYFAHVQPFLQAFCVSCHGSSHATGDITLYHEPKRGRTPANFWAHALSRMKDTANPMPPVPPTTCDDKERLQNGIRLFEAWASNGFAEKAGGSAPTTVDPSVNHFPKTDSCKGKDPLPARIWRVSGRQMRYILLDAFDKKVTPPQYPFVYQHNDSFDNNASSSLITSIDMVHMMKWADTFSKDAIKSIPEFQACINGTGRLCVKRLVVKYAERLWRRALTRTEIYKLMDSFTALEKEVDRTTGMETMIELMILSSNTLYRSEVGTPVNGQPGIRKLTSYEVASFLSFTIWQSIPDDTLRKAAELGQVSTMAEVRAHIARMIKMPAAERGMYEFFYDWLQLDKITDDTRTKDSQLFPFYTPALRQSLLKESELMIGNVIWKRLGTLQELFTTNQTFANRDVAALYGMSASASSFQPLMTSANERAGILTTPGFLAAHAKTKSTDIVHRGLFVLLHLLCQTVGDPPAGATEAGNNKLKGKDQSKMTERSILELKTSSGSCTGCHSQINPPGFAFELYDPTGRYRTTEKGGLSLDASGSSTLVDASSPGFQDGVGFIRKLAQSTTFRQCFTLKMFDYHLGTRPRAGQSCQVASLYDSLQANQFKLAKSYEAIVSMPHFFLRKEALTSTP
jgi:cytochrome c553